MSENAPERPAAEQPPTGLDDQRRSPDSPDAEAKGEGVAASSDNAASSNDEESAHDGFDVQLEEFAGPLDLLLSLIRRHKINIRDIPIARITEQFLGYIRQAEELNIDLGGEFVFMAATLIHIKSKMLLPKDPTVSEEEQEDPRDELVQQLLEHEKFTRAADMLREKRIVEESVWSNPSIAAFQEEEEDPGLAVSVFDLVKTFEDVLERFKNRPTYDIETDEVSVGGRIEFLKNMLLSEDRPLSLREVFERQPSMQSLVATFLALLEMVRMQAILFRQKEMFGEIVIRKHKMFDTVFSEDGLLAAADAEYRS